MLYRTNMTKIPTLKIILDDYFQQKSIELILKRALESQAFLYTTENYDFNIPSAQIAAQIIFNVHDNTKQGGKVFIEIGNTKMLLFFVSSVSDLIVEILPISNHWEKTFLNGECKIDLAHYMLLLLNITQDFPIINIEIKH